MRVIYVCGPYRAETKHRRDINILKARAVTVELLKRGWSVLCPHLLYARFDDLYPEIDDAVYLEADLELLRRCDAIFLMRLWCESAGAKREFEEARERGVPVYYELGGYPSPW